MSSALANSPFSLFFPFRRCSCLTWPLANLLLRATDLAQTNNRHTCQVLLSSRLPQPTSTTFLYEGEGKERRGFRKCDVQDCRERETFSGATPMLYNIWRDNAGGAQTSEEFVSFLADLSAEVFQRHKRESALQSLEQLRAWTESRLGRVDWTLSRPVQDVVSKVSKFLGFDSPSSELIARVSQGGIGHVSLLVHPRLMAMGINSALKEGRWDTYFYLPDWFSVSREGSQEPED